MDMICTVQYNTIDSGSMVKHLCNIIPKPNDSVCFEIEGVSAIFSIKELEHALAVCKSYNENK